jgi:hypothetical protein
MALQTRREINRRVCCAIDGRRPIALWTDTRTILPRTARLLINAVTAMVSVTTLPIIRPNLCCSVKSANVFAI